MEKRVLWSLTMGDLGPPHHINYANTAKTELKLTTWARKHPSIYPQETVKRYACQPYWSPLVSGVTYKYYMAAAT